MARSKDVRVANMSAFAVAIANTYKLQYGFVIKELDKITKNTAEEMAEAIRKAAPIGETGRYAAGWVVTGRITESGAKDFTVYNEDRYMLTHLLEFDHYAGKDYHRVEGHPHIQAVVDKYNDLYIERITKAYDVWGG